MRSTVHGDTLNPAYHPLSAIADRIREQGIRVVLAYPGYLILRVPGRPRVFMAGDANGQSWAIDVYRSSAAVDAGDQPTEVLNTGVPIACDDARIVGDAIVANILDLLNNKGHWS